MKVLEKRSYYLVVACKEHVQKGVELGIAQACHGKCSPLKKMKVGDGVVYYSPKIKMEGKSKENQYQCFTAIGTVAKNDTPYQVEMTQDFKPWRINVNFDKNVQHVPIKSLLDSLEFIQTGGSNWGLYVRKGFRKISEADFSLIEEAMKSVVNLNKESC